MGAAKPKIYVLDTNVLIHDPRSLFYFAEHDVALLAETLEELDKFKGEVTERGQSAREVHRELSRLFASGTQVTDRVPLPDGGHVFFVVNRYLTRREFDSPGMRELTSIFSDMDKMDNRILAGVVYLRETSGQQVVLVSKDVNMQLKARAVGLEAEDYRKDKISEQDAVVSDDYPTLSMTGHQLQAFYSAGEVLRPDDAGMPVNEYLLFKDEETGKTCPARHYGQGEFRRLNLPKQITIPGGITIRPANLGQQFLTDALMDPNISLVTCVARAGAGKTLISTAIGLMLVTQGIFDGMTISRPVIEMGKGIGFLPGSMEDKMKPWLQPYYDALNLLMPAKIKQAQPGKPRSQRKDQPQRKEQPGSGRPIKPYERLLESGLIEIEALAYIRGRSIPNRLFILDEVQNTTLLEIKTVVTRMSRGSKLVLLGDPDQIDNPYVDSRSNGLVGTRNRLKGQRIAAHVKLTKGERSELAEVAATML